MNSPGGSSEQSRRKDDPTRFIPWLRDHNTAFASIPPRVIEQMFEGAATMRVKRDHCLLAQDSRADRIFILISGNVAVRVARAGIVRELLGYGPAEVAGLLAIVDQRGAPYEIRTVTDCEVVAVDANRIARLRAAYHPVGMVVLDAFMPMLIEHLRQLDERAVRLAQRKSAAMSGSGQTYRRDDR